MILTHREKVGVITLKGIDEIKEIFDVDVGLLDIKSFKDPQAWRDLIWCSPPNLEVKKWLNQNNAEYVFDCKAEWEPDGISKHTRYIKLTAHLTFPDPDKAFLFKMTFG